MKNVYLAAEAGAYVPVTVSAPEVVLLETYIVKATTSSAMFDPGATDTSTFISNRDIQNMVMGDRTLGSLLANDPRIIYNRNPEQQYISASGINNRYNQIMVDGISVSDPYGLNANGMAAQNNVMPIEAIESIAISTSPYNARKGGFTGASINAVTKSGGNEFHGSVYYTFRNRDLVGEHLDGQSKPVTNFKEQTYGMTLGGPILKNKVFFFGAIEQKNYNKPTPTPGYALTGTTMNKIVDGLVALNSGTAANGNIINPGHAVPYYVGTTPFPYTYTGSNTAAAANIVPNNSSGPGTNTMKDTVGTAKVEWQINPDQRVTVGYQFSHGNRPTYPSFSTSSASSLNNFSFSNSWYTLTKKSSSITAAWTSRWTDKLYTELNVGYSKYNTSNDNNPVMPYVQIRGVEVITGTSALTPSGTSSSAYVTMGTDGNYQLNKLSVKTKTIEAFASYKLGSGHTLEGGLQYNNNDVNNLFVSYNAGYYIFNTLQQFLDYTSGKGKAIYTYYYNALKPDVDPAANFTEANLGIFIRDNWRVARSLTLDLNIRVDTPIIDKDPAFNQKFYDTFKLNNSETYDGQFVIQPRIGFNWQPKINDGKYTTVIRGGGGLFYGGMPRVWLANSYSNTGFNYSAFQFTGTSNSTPNYPVFSSDPGKQQTTGIGLAPTQTVNTIAPGFKVPTRWKGNIAIEQELPWWGMKASVELEGSMVENDVVYKSINIKSNSFSEAAPDGRPMYWGTYTSGTGSATLNRVNTSFSNNCMEMMNSNEGYTTAVTFAIQRPMKADGWQWMAAYTYTETFEASYNNSSIASSNWNSRTVFDPNAVEPHRGDGEIRDRFLVNLTKRLNLLPVGATTLTLTYNGRSGLPYSLRAYNDVNGDGQYNDVLFVPNYSQTAIVGSGSAKYMFASESDRQTFYKIAKKYGLTEGQVTKVNGQRYPWVNQFDIHIGQEVKLPGWRHALELSVDVLNIGNMLNDKWGLVYGVDENYVKSESIATVVYNNTSKSYTYSRPTTPTFTPWLDKAYTGEPAASRWSILLSIKYKF